MKIAMLGGSFNPPHIGHLAAAEEVRIQCGYDVVFFIPAHISPFKDEPPGASDADRLAMLALSVAGNPCFRVEDCEIRRGGVSYTIDTVTYLEQKYGNGRETGDPLEGKIGLILGDDLSETFYLWRNARELAVRTDLLLARRLSARQYADFPYPHTCIDNALLPVSSTDIRNRVAAGKSYRYLVPQDVYLYIEQRRLYGR